MTSIGKISKSNEGGARTISPIQSSGNKVSSRKTQGDNKTLMKKAAGGNIRMQGRKYPSQDLSSGNNEVLANKANSKPSAMLSYISLLNSNSQPKTTLVAKQLSADLPTSPAPVRIAKAPANLIPAQTDAKYIKWAVPTPQAAADLRAAGVANVFSQPWQDLVNDAAKRNSGFGNTQDGYLAFSKIGFVRLKNDNLTSEQNERLARFSLEMGVPIENTPARSDESVKNNPKIGAWVDNFVSDYETQFENFAKDPTQGIAVKDGRRRFVMKFDESSGVVGSFDYKKSGGLRGFVQKNFKIIKPIADIVSTVGAFVPGIGPALALGGRAVIAISSLIAAGKVKAKNLLSAGLQFAAGALPMASTITSAVGQFGSGALGAALGAASTVVETGKLKARQALSAAASFFAQGYATGVTAQDVLVREGARLGSKAIATGSLSDRDLLGSAVGSLAAGVNGTEFSDNVVRTGIDAAATATREGELSEDAQISFGAQLAGYALQEYLREEEEKQEPEVDEQRAS